jgi:hypothetical protein
VTRRLAVVVADKHIEQAVRGLLSRPEALAISPVEVEVAVHPNRDPGCFHTGHEILSAYRGSCSHALVVFDRAWEGSPPGSALDLEHEVNERLRTKWGDRSRCIVIDPEVEIWVWSASPHVARELGWADLAPGLREWLIEQDLWPANAPKPPDPKRAFDRTLRHVRQPRSSAIFRRLAERVSLTSCQDASFKRLVAALRAWFPPVTDPE